MSARSSPVLFYFRVNAVFFVSSVVEWSLDLCYQLPGRVEVAHISEPQSVVLGLLVFYSMV